MNDPLDNESDDKFQLPPPPKEAKRDGEVLLQYTQMEFGINGAWLSSLILTLIL